jgi:hypothetical protein
MSAANRVLYLRIVLIVVGLTFIFGIYPLGLVWPSGWTWGHGHSHYLMMIIGVYATLGVFLLMASRDPDAHKSIIWFTVWSSVVHGAIMAWQAFTDPAERGHLIADVPALFLLTLDKHSYNPHIAARAFCWQGWGHEEEARSCGAGGAALAWRSIVATRGASC